LVVAGQVEASISELTAEEVAKIVIAYEPVWAIGTGHVCEPETAGKVAGNIRNLIKVLYGAKAAEKVHVVYGGSLDDKNIVGFLGESELDGFLVGTASLDHKKFSKMVALIDKPYTSKKSPEKSDKGSVQPKKQKPGKKK
jgi:triosephosphate isomerase